MKRLLITLSIVVIAIIGITLLKQSGGVGSFLWDISNKGAWLLPLVLVAALLDSVHPCSFSILLITIAFLFGMQMTRKRILQIGGTYIAGIFSAYLLIGLGILKTLNFFNVPHFMGKLGAVMLLIFGLINILGELFPNFPIKLKLPSAAHGKMANLMEKASIPAAFGLGILVGICQFPCMGGPYLMVIGLLHDKMTYFSGFGYLTLYNFILIIPLAVVLWIAANKLIVDKMQAWKKENTKGVKFWAGLIMVVLGAIIFFL
jgi:cytochrome c biogenesis protein CcdA